MTENDFHTEIDIDATPAEVFAGIQDVRGWWSPTLEGSSSDEGDEFVYSDEGIHHARIRLTRVEPSALLEWTVIDSYLNFVDDHEEWTGTHMVFEVSPGERDTTRLAFTHHGLQPQVACFEACSSGWGRCMVSLERLITDSRGRADARASQ